MLTLVGFSVRNDDDKVPFLKTAQGSLCEPQVVFECLEDAHPERPLLPAGSLQREKVRRVNAERKANAQLMARERPLA